MAAIPEKIGPYRILRKLGEGGMGAVYEGLHELIERKVAIKILRPEYAAKPEFTARFFNEARAVNRVDHPGLVQISDYGQLPDTTTYIVMEFLNGESLATRLKNRAAALPLEQALNMGSQLADSLAAAHEKNIIHRDLKPDNVMVVSDSKAPGGERAKLLDFGIAKLADDTPDGVGPGHVRTSTNSLLGTPYYMSPEQCRGAGKVDGRSDVYALGVMMYEMLSGVRPITGEGQGDILVKHITEEPTPLRTRMPDLPEAVTALVHLMMTKDRDKRPTMGDVAGQLEALSAQYPPPSTRRSTANMPLVVLPPAGAAGLPTNAGTAAGQAGSGRARGRSLGLALLFGVAIVIAGVVGLRSLRPRPAVVMPASTASAGTEPATPSVPTGPAAAQPQAPPTTAANPTTADPDGDSTAAPKAGGSKAGKGAAKAGTKGKKAKAASKNSLSKGGRQIED